MYFAAGGLPEGRQRFPLEESPPGGQLINGHQDPKVHTLIISLLLKQSASSCILTLNIDNV